MKQKISAAFLLFVMFINITAPVFASSHREAPMIANDPLADNTDVYAFRSPDDPNKVTIIANYVPFQLPDGGPNYYSFGENIRYEIHIDNNIGTKGDDIIYRFTFKKANEFNRNEVLCLLLRYCVCSNFFSKKYFSTNTICSTFTTQMINSLPN